MSGGCPRIGCDNRLDDADDVLCRADFVLLASMCRGKKRLGAPEAAHIEASSLTRQRQSAYRCVVCAQHHNGGIRRDAPEIRLRARTAVAALNADPRVGWQGVLKLADAWAPGSSARMGWRDGLDQRAAYR